MGSEHVLECVLNAFQMLSEHNLNVFESEAVVIMIRSYRDQRFSLFPKV